MANNGIVILEDGVQYINNELFCIECIAEGKCFSTLNFIFFDGGDVYHAECPSVQLNLKGSVVSLWVGVSAPNTQTVSVIKKYIESRIKIAYLNKMAVTQSIKINRNEKFDANFYIKYISYGMCMRRLGHRIHNKIKKNVFECASESCTKTIYDRRVCKICENGVKIMILIDSKYRKRSIFNILPVELIRIILKKIVY